MFLILLLNQAPSVASVRARKQVRRIAAPQNDFLSELSEFAQRWAGEQ
jgi:hypothetical protein